MKAIRIHEHGGPEVLRFEDVEIAPPGPGEVRVRHTAIALNFSDVNVRRGGFYKNAPPALPLIPGNEAAGVVTGERAGREVHYRLVDDHLAEIVVAAVAHAGEYTDLESP